VHKGIIALDLKAGKQKWQAAELAFAGFQGTDLVLTKADASEGKDFLKVNSATGKIIEETQNITLNREIENGTLQNPVHLLEESQQFSRISGFIRQSTAKHCVLALDYLEHMDHIIIAFYTREDDRLQNYLLLVNAKGKVLFCRLMNENLKGIGKDAFFVFHNKIIFIENKSELLLYTF